MKTCHKCKAEKPLEEFPSNKTKKDGRSETCLGCKREYNRQHYLNNKQYYVDKAQNRKDTLKELFQNYKCRLKCPCGEDHPAALEFHHSDAKQKEFTVAIAVNRGWSAKRIMQEVHKCEVLCSNCHRKLHWNERYAPGV